MGENWVSASEEKRASRRAENMISGKRGWVAGVQKNELRGSRKGTHLA